MAAFLVGSSSLPVRRSPRRLQQCSGRLLLRDRDDDVREPALVAERATHRGRADALHARTFVRDRGADVEVVDIDVQALLLREVGGVLDRRAQHLLDHRRHALGGEVDGVERLLDAQALDEVEDELRLLRAGALELRLSAELSDFFYCDLCHDSSSFELHLARLQRSA